MDNSESEKLENSNLEQLDKPRSNMFYVLILLGVAVVSFLIGYMILKITVNKRYKALIEEIKGRGEATEFSKIPIEELEDSENAATYIKRAFETYIDFQETIDEDADEDYWLLADNEWENYSFDALRKFPDRMRIFRNYIKQNEKTITLLQEGLRRPKANFEVDYENNEIPMLSVLTLRRILTDLINLSILDNDSELTVKQIVNMLRLALVTSSEHTTIARLVVIALEEEALKNLRFVYDNIKFNEPQLEKLIKELGRFEQIKSITDVLISERCFSLTEYKDEVNFDSSQPFGVRSSYYGKIGKWIPEPIIRLDCILYINELGKVIELSKKPYHEINDDLFAMLTKWEDNKSIYQKMTALCLPYSIYTVFRNDVLTALSRIARTTLAVELFKLRHGKLPQTLSELADAGILKEMPIDPFTGEPLIYEVSGLDFFVFSKGFDDADYPYDSYENWEIDGNLVWKYDDDSVDADEKDIEDSPQTMPQTQPENK